MRESAENRGDGEVEEEEELPSLLTVLTVPSVFENHHAV